jgi:hypothetical protein
MKKQEVLPANADEKPDFSLIDENFLKSRIYTIRGVKVMLDADLAEIYGYTTKRFNEQVKTNIERFEGDFRFQLTKLEYTAILRSEKPTLEQGKYSKFLPFAFTEQGIYMLMTVLKGERAIAQSKSLIRLFKQMKDYIVAENRQLLGNAGITEFAVQTVQNTREIASVSTRVETISGEVHDMREDLGKMNLDLQKVMENFIDPTTYKHFLILDGQKLESDVAFTKIYGMAKKSIIIIDNYVGVKTLDLLRGIAKNASVRIFSEELNGRITPEIKADYEKARPDVSLKIDRPNRKFHDRYVFLDYGTRSEKLFHCGASSKDGGNKITTIMQIECPEMYHPIVEEMWMVSAESEF